MEGSSYNPEYDLKDETPEKKRPKVETIGSLVVEASPEHGPEKRHAKEKLGHTLVDLETRKTSPEKNFELDPVLRNGAHDLAPHSTTSTTSLNGLLKKADAAIDGKSDATAHAKAKTAAQPNNTATTQRRVVDVVMISTILVLTTLVIVLILTR
jgi:hypothetical protein